MVDHGQKRTKVIGFYGVAQAGKSTAAQFAAQWFRDRGYNVQLRSFAGPLKDGLKEMGIEKDTHPDLYREAAQFMGTEVCRKYDSDWWINQMSDKVDKASEGTIIIIDDCRFMNEFDYLDSVDADKIFVMAGGRVDLTDPMYQHTSEAVSYEYETVINGILPNSERHFQVKPDHLLSNNIEMPVMLEHLGDILLKIEGKLL